MPRPALAALALLLFAAPLQAQQTLALHTPETVRAAPDLEAEARALHDDPASFPRAAELYLRAAYARGAADARGVDDRRLAALLYHYAGDDALAADVMEGAGEAALVRGDVVTAAHAFIDAAWLARRAARTQDVLRLAARAQLLMASPLLDDAARRGVLERVRRGEGSVRAVAFSAPRGSR